MEKRKKRLLKKNKSVCGHRGILPHTLLQFQCPPTKLQQLVIFSVSLGIFQLASKFLAGKNFFFATCFNILPQTVIVTWYTCMLQYRQQNSEVTTR